MRTKVQGWETLGAHERGEGGRESGAARWQMVDGAASDRPDIAADQPRMSNAWPAGTDDPPTGSHGWIGAAAPDFERASSAMAHRGRTAASRGVGVRLVGRPPTPAATSRDASSRLAAPAPFHEVEHQRTTTLPKLFRLARFANRGDRPRGGRGRLSAGGVDRSWPILPPPVSSPTPPLPFASPKRENKRKKNKHAGIQDDGIALPRKHRARARARGAPVARRLDW